MITLLWILGGISIFAWPFYAMMYMSKYREQKYSPIIIYLIALTPSALLIGTAAYLSDIQKDVISEQCGVVEAYQTYMSSGNKNKRQSFERVTIFFYEQKYSRHLRFSDELSKKEIGKRVCFQFYDRKLNSHLSDSKIIAWLDEH